MDKHYNIYCWIWPNNADYKSVSKDISYDEAIKIRDNWMDKSVNHDAIIVDVSDKIGIMCAEK